MASNGVPPPTPDGFRRVLATFRARLTRDELENFKFVTLEEVKQTIVNIQAEQEKRKETMNFTRIQGFLEAMNQFGKVVEVFLNASEILCFVWGPLKFLLQVASSWAESFDNLLDAYQQIAEQIPLLLQYQKVFEQNHHMASVLEMMYKDILDFHQQALRVFGKSTWRQLFRAVWSDFNTRFKHLISNLQRHKGLIESQASILEIEAAQAARELAEKHFEATESYRRDHQRLVVRTWLSARNADLDHEACLDMRRDYPTTGLWILGRAEIVAWRDRQNTSVPLVWVHGKPGAGKTILASVIVEKSRIQPSTTVAFFYCKYKDRERSTFVAVVRALLLQLLTQSNDSDLLQVLYESCRDSGEEALEVQARCTELLTTAVGTVAQGTIIHLVIDGLDECESNERKKILSTITTILREDSQPGRVRAIFTSQPEPDIRSLLRKASVVRVTESDNSGDIAEYTKHWCVKIQDKFTLANERRDFIHKLVCGGAEGMFLFAKLVLQNLHAQTNRAQLHDAILPDRFPKGLDKAYEKIIERIKHNENEAERDQAIMLLGWVATAKRPLTWPEIQGAISIDVEGETVDFEDRSLVVGIEELCGSLIERLAGDRIELVHMSAKIYLAQDNHIRLSKAEGQIATLCLEYLTFREFHKDDEDLTELVETGFFAFQNYATLHWVDHLQSYLETLKIDDLDDLERLGPICEEYSEVYRADYDHTAQEIALSQLRDSCHSAKQQASFETFLALIAQARAARRSDDSFDGLGRLGHTMRQSRELLEHEVETPRVDSVPKESLATFYGSNFFKCPRHMCYYFHEGFTTSRLRDTHVKQHDRPFCCDEDGCSRIRTGFCTKEDLQRHMKKNHMKSGISELRFAKPKPKRRVAAASGPPIEQTKRVRIEDFQCDYCPKQFTRASTLAEHRRRHTGERPFVCHVCNQSFIAKKDCRRHQAIHGAETFVCTGSLKDGRSWGCGKGFTRSDALHRHFRSATGQNCLRPLFAEESAAKTQSQPASGTSYAQENFNGYEFPAALLDQYPDLENLDWAEGASYE